MPPSHRYDWFAIVLHWAMALGIAMQVVLGLAMVHFPPSLAAQFQWFQLHKSIGVTVLLAGVLRLVWRIRHRPPPLPSMPAAERAAAVGTHVLLYALMFALPFSGWALVSASPLNLPTMLYGRIPWPHLPPFASMADKQAAETSLQWVHAWLAWGLLALLALHVAATARHAWRGDAVMRRMVPLPARRMT